VEGNSTIAITLLLAILGLLVLSSACETIVRSGDGRVSA